MLKSLDEQEAETLRQLDEIEAEILWRVAVKSSPANPYLYFADDWRGFFRAVLGIYLWTPDQERVADSFAQNRNTAAPSGHGTGKDWLAARLALWRLYCARAGKAKVITTANTESQLKLVLWGEIRSAWLNARVKLPGQLNTLELKLGPDWYMVGLTARDSHAFQGHHSPEITVIYDEACGIALEFFMAGQSLAVGPFDRQFAIFNPTDPASEIKRKCESGLWNVVRMDAENHPNVIEDRQVLPGAVTRTYISEIAEEYGGRESPVFQSRVKGFFPEQGADSLISVAWVEASVERWKSAPYGQGYYPTVSAGCDVARFGDDDTVIYEMDDRGTVSQAEWWQGQRTTHTAGKLMAMRHIPNIAVDDCGVGGGVTDQCVAESLYVIAVNASEAADDPLKFFNRRAEIYWHLREELRLGRIQIPDDRKLVGELTNIKYHFRKGRIQIEEKAEIKKRLGRSPDRADALALAVWAARMPRDLGGYHCA